MSAVPEVPICSAMMTDEEVRDLFFCVDTGLMDIQSAGWVRDCDNSGEHVRWMRHFDDGDTSCGCQVRHLPMWVRELVEEAERRGAKAAQARLRRALGL